jgi:hypothetical protein
MQKINREQLAKDVADFDFSDDVEDFAHNQVKITVEEAHRLRSYAAILLEITDPEFVPSEGMKTSFNDLYYKRVPDIFRAMIKDVVE